MRLLEIIFCQLMVVLALVFIASKAFADSECDGDEKTNHDIIICSQQAYEKIDKIINYQYRQLIGGAGEHRKTVVKSQLSWIKYKEEYCADAYGSSYPGQEASIDRLSCLTQVTGARVNEIIYLRTGVINDGFHKAASIISKDIAGYDYIKAKAFLGGQGEYGGQWEIYARENCSIAKLLYGEDESTCFARMAFQTPID